jgi:hypothetical protein
MAGATLSATEGMKMNAKGQRQAEGLSYHFALASQTRKSWGINWITVEIF